MAQMDRFRFGVLSTGNIARQFTQGVAGSRHCEVAAVASREPARAEAFAAEYGVPRTHTSYEALVADPSLDAVYVAVPNHLHAEWTIHALNAGRHVLCEKPLATGLAEAEAMFAAAERAERLLVEGYMYRTHPLTREVLGRVRAGEIGPVRLIRTSFCYHTPRQSPDVNVRFDPAQAGGALMDIGCYCLDFAQLVAGGPPTRIEAVSQPHETEVDAYTAGALTFEAGVMATFQCGMTVQADNTAMICGERGYIEVPVPWKPPQKDAVYVVRGQTPPKQDGGGAAPGPVEHTVSADAPLFGIEADAFACAARGQAEPFITSQESLSLCKILEQAREQAGQKT